MPTIQVQGKLIHCENGANLRQVLLKEGIELYNGNAKYINCMGLGTCGTCAVEIDDEESSRNWIEQGRLSIPPHNPRRNLRLACQISVTHDMKITKYDRFWGQGERKNISPEKNISP